MLLNIDVDGVLADFHPAFCKMAITVLGREFPTTYAEFHEVEKALGIGDEEADRVWAEVCGPGYAATLEAVERGVSVVQRLCKRHDVAFVTSPLKKSPTWGYDRAQWIHQHFEGSKYAIVSTECKRRVDADLFIEDRADVVCEWLTERHDRGNHDAFAILYARPYNKEGMPKKFEDRSKRLSDWFEIESFIDHWLPG